MLSELVHRVLYSMSYTELYLWTLLFFLLLYFGLGQLFLGSCRVLNSWGAVSRIEYKKVERKQIIFEIRNSMVSIFVFGFSSLPIIYLVRKGTISLAEDTLVNVLAGVILLNIWNELHFYIIHRIMHHPYLMKKIHYIHHRSRVPTIHSVYSFHWIEALLLSTVPLSVAPFIDLAPLVFIVYPVTSILFNFSGHSNYRFGNGEGHSLKLFATRHNAHHSSFKNTYGFTTDIFDIIFRKLESLIRSDRT